MILEIHSDIEGKFFEVSCKNKKFSGYPNAIYDRFGGWTVPIRKQHWYDDLVAIASWVNNELKDDCEFTVG